MIDSLTTTERPKSARGNIQSLERASLLLDAVAAGGERGASLTDMGEATGLHSSTVFHLVKTEKVSVQETLEIINLIKIVTIHLRQIIIIVHQPQPVSR